MKIAHLKKFKLPNKPGVYFFLKGKEIVYIGKATSLRDRVKSYFSKDLIETRGPIILDMVFKADQIKFEVTDSVLEALILEAELIKRYQPKSNTKEKSDKSFNYVLITKDEVPKVLIVRGKDLPNHKGPSFGPYTNGAQLKTALQIIRKIFPFVDEASSKRANVEFYKQIHLTPANTEEYLRNIKNLKLFLHGKKKDVLRNLKKEMNAYAKVKAFERAGEVKRQIFALMHINDVALLKGDKVFSRHAVRIEAYDIAHMGGKNMVGVMTVVENGEAVKSEYKKFKIRTQSDANDTGALKEVLERRLGHPEWPAPAFIVVDGSTAQINTAEAVIAKMDLSVPVVSVVKDDKHKAKDIMGDKTLAVKYKREILLANSEAHRFAISYHKNMRNKNFLK
ncbi:MAG: UvrB/UvrC motif-containing protein [Candidatus Pacebacteria bacterium]|jgi:excinuclease ABC subunit C|nr:UvrB/UvrC motif-containing protein [Candidatus Paceibacterota bacterium]